MQNTNKIVEYKKLKNAELEKIYLWFDFGNVIVELILDHF